MLPQEYIKWLTTQSETVLSIWPVRSKRRAMEAMIDSVDHKSTFIFMDKIISRFLTRNLGAGQAAVADEIAASVDDTMGLDEDAWCDVNLAQTFKEIGDRSGVRALFGFALCRDRHFLRILNRYKTLMGVGIFMSGQLPPPIRPIVSLLLVLPFRFSKTRVTRVLTPIVKERMREAACEQVDSTLENQAHDLLTQSIRTIMNEKSNTHRNNADYIADEFLVLVSLTLTMGRLNVLLITPHQSFASLASIALVAGNLFLDILSTPNAYARLRAEAADVFTSAADWADPAVLKKLILTDSAIRESLRRSSIQTRGLLREVVAKDGVNLPDGTHVARGTWLGVPVEAVHMDDKFYDRPEEYNPWRFARMSSEDVVGGDKVEATEVNEKFLGWSYGKHAWLVMPLSDLMATTILPTRMVRRQGGFANTS